MLGFDAIGRLAVGQVHQASPTTTVLPVSAASYTVTSSAVSFKLIEPVTQSTVTIATVTNSELVKEAVTSAAVAISAPAVSFKLTESVSPGALSIASPVIGEMTSVPVASAPFGIQTFAVPFRTTANAVPAAYVIAGQAVNTFEVEPITPAAVLISPLDVPVTRTGADFDLVYGGVGHYKWERERARQLAAITRTIPPAIDRRSAPTYGPISLARPPMAPAAPAVDMAAVQKQLMAEQMQAAATAAKRRRNEQALLLLAS